MAVNPASAAGVNWAHPLARELQLVVLRDRVFTRPAQRGAYTVRTTSGAGLATGTTAAAGLVAGAGISFVVVADLTAVSADALAIGRARYNGSANYGALLRFNGSTLEFDGGPGTSTWGYATKTGLVTVGRNAYGSTWAAGAITDTVGLYKNGAVNTLSSANATNPNPAAFDASFDVGRGTASGSTAITAAIAGCIEVGLYYATDLSASEMAAIHEAALRGKLPFLYQSRASRRRNRVPVSAGGSSYSSTLTESATTTDAATAAYIATAAVSEAITAADSLAAATTWVRSLTEAATAAESITTAGTFAASITEPASGADALTSAVTWARALTEAATASDSQATGSIYTGSVTEAASVADALTAAATLVALLTEVATASDAATSAATWVRLLTEPAAAVDSVAGAQGATYIASVTEVLAAAELLVAVLGSTEALGRYTIAAKARRLTITAKPRRLEIRK